MTSLSEGTDREGTSTGSAARLPQAAPCAGQLSTVPPPSTMDPSEPALYSQRAPTSEEFPEVPGYEILSRLGQGGMGQVFKARPIGADRVVALKIIRSDRQEDAQLIRRFQREAKAGSRLSHPNIVAFEDAQQVENVYYLTMEFVDGTDLAQLLKRADGPLPIPLACECARQVALGLQHAHERGMIHRDIKPSNLVLTKEGDLVKILDMGLVRLGTCPVTGHAESELTLSGLMMGTPAYMAPEQVFDARNVDGRADLYSLGCTLYELLAGRAPHRHQMKEPVPIDWLRPEVSPVLAAVVQRMMARMPEDRYPAAVDVAQALGPFCSPRADLSERDHEAVGAQAGSNLRRAERSPAARRLIWLAFVGAFLLMIAGIIGLTWVVALRQ